MRLSRHWILRILIALSTVVCGLGSPAAGAAPQSADAHTVLLLHLDGNPTDASAHQHAGQTKGTVAWTPGRFGQALSLDGTGGVVVPRSPVLMPGNQSWMLECWIKPETNQPMHAILVGDAPGLGRQYWLRISYNNHIAFGCAAGPHHLGSVSSADIRERLFDGKWHHLAGVRDQGRNGELRIYLDGEDVSRARVAMSYPVVPESGKMSATVGAISSSYVGRDGYRGLIDEVRISNAVRTGFTAHPGDPQPAPPAPFPVPPQARLRADDPSSREPLKLEPATTVILVPVFPGNSDYRTARLLQEQLRRVHRTQTGFDIRNEFVAGDLSGQAILACGRTQLVTPADRADDLERYGFLVRRKGNAVLFLGGSARGAYYGAVKFLDRYAGVRFYLPGELWTSLPESRKIVLGPIDMQEAPYVKTGHASGSGGVPGAGTWFQRNAFDRRDSTHQHTMNQRFSPARFAKKYPRIYPTIDGKTYIPQSSHDQRWNPSFSEPTLVDAAEESAIAYFEQNPQAQMIAFSVLDSHAHCERDLASAEVKEHGKGPGISNLYWRFMNRLAARLEKRYPDKKLVGIAYAEVRHPPPFELHPNIVAWLVFKIADIGIDRRFDTPDSWCNTWAKRASHVANHDWAYGHGYLIPRTYTEYVQQTFLEFEKRGAPLRHMYAEAGPNWGLDGPKLYLMAQLWWNPRVDVQAKLRQFCDDLFGPAAAEMLHYFTKLELLYREMNADNERKLFRWKDRQFGLDDEEWELVRQCRGHLDKARGMTRGDEGRRIELFSKTFRYSEYWFELKNRLDLDPAKLDEIRAYARDVIAPDPMTVFRKAEEGAVTNQAEQVIRALTR